MRTQYEGAFAVGRTQACKEGHHCTDYCPVCGKPHGTPEQRLLRAVFGEPSLCPTCKADLVFECPPCQLFAGRQS